MEHAGGTKLLKMATVCAVNSSGGVVHPALLTEARKAAEQCNANLRSPRPPQLRLSWACCHTESYYYKYKCIHNYNNNNTLHTMKYIIIIIIIIIMNKHTYT